MRVAAACLALFSVLGFLLLSLGSRTSPERRQPIAFSHLLHAGRLEVSCRYCHSFARRSPVAGMPSVKRCMGCHDLVAYEAEEVQKLADYWERGEPILWEKIYDLPDHTRFSHEAHVRQGIGCATCHGPVEAMEEITLAQPLQMGWCIDCHRQRRASVDCLTCHH